jgi:hypothetical protein
MTVTIRTHYQGPEGARGSRIWATTRVNGRRRSKTVPYDHGARDAHAAGALTLAQILGADLATFELIDRHRSGGTYRIQLPA